MLKKFFSSEQVPFVPKNSASDTQAIDWKKNTHLDAIVTDDLPEITHKDELPEFNKKLYDLINMHASPRHLVCPVEVDSLKNEGGKKFAIICLRNEVKGDIVTEVTTQLGFKGFSKAEKHIYVASQSVMAELARDTINEVKKENAKDNVHFIGRHSNSALHQMFESIANFAIDSGASDIHFVIDTHAPKSQIKFRVDGRLTSPKNFNLQSHDLLDTVAYLYNCHGSSGSENSYNANKPQQCQIQMTIAGRKILFRWASNQTAKGTKVVLRMLFQDNAVSIRSLEELGYLPSQIEIWKRAIRRLGGGTLLSGVVNSGKSTTMQTVLNMLPDNMSVYTVEDPVEYLIPGVDQFSVSRNLSDHNSSSFLAVTRQLKRMDPDAVLIGEIRDQESAALFRDIAESGHRAFATVHAPSAIDTVILRLVSDEIGIPRGVLATPGFINLLVYQALVPKICENCRLPATKIHNDEYLSRIEQLFSIQRDSIYARNPDGCECCRRPELPELNGGKGRTVVAEMVEMDSVMLDLLRQEKNAELKEYIRQGKDSKFDEPFSKGKSALEVAMYHVSQGRIDPIDVEEKFGTFVQYEIELGR